MKQRVPTLVKNKTGKRSRVLSVHQLQVQAADDDRVYWTGQSVEEIICRAAAGENIADVGETLDVRVDPDTARKWLTRNIHNRRVSQATVDKYVADMDAGLWLYTHQGIAFDSAGHLIDGQQRLLACSISGCKFPTQVTLNLPVGTGLAVDQGRARTVADVATLLTGEPVSPEAAAVANRMMSSMSPKVGATRTELVQFLQRYRPQIDSSISLLPNRSLAGRCGPRAVVARALVTTPEFGVVRVQKFCEVLVTGKYQDGPEYGVFLLREWLAKNRHGGSYGLLESYRRTSGALVAFLRERSVLRLTPANSEQFKLPDEE